MLMNTIIDSKTFDKITQKMISDLLNPDNQNVPQIKSKMLKNLTPSLFNKQRHEQQEQNLGNQTTSAQLIKAIASS